MSSELYFYKVKKVDKILPKGECGHFIGPSFRILANIPLSFCSRVLS